MADDIITFGGPERLSRRDADESVESLFHAHYPRIVYTAFSLVGDWDLAEQLAQEAYLRLWRRWRWISDPQAAPMYLQRTVVNLSRETIRRKVIERRALRTKGAADRVAAPPAPDTAAVVELRRAVAALPVRKRECVVLRFLLGLSEAETAGLLGISVGTVKSQTHKGLRLLRDRLDDRAATAGPGGAAWQPAGQGTGFGAAGGSQPGPATARPANASGPRVAGPHGAGPHVEGPRVAGPHVEGPRVAGPPHAAGPSAAQPRSERKPGRAAR